MQKPTDTMLQITKEALFRFQRKGSRKSLLGLVVVIALLGFGFGVVDGTDEPTPPEPLKIGYLADYSGPLAEYGAAIELGVKLAVEQINAAGGINGQPVTYVTGDTALGSGMATAIATAEARRLIDVEGVSAIVGPLESSIALAVAEEVAADAQIPVVSPYATWPNLTNANDNGYLFRTSRSSASEGVVLANNLVEADGVDNVAVVYVNNPYGAGLSGAFEANFDGTVTRVPYKWGATSYLAELQAAAANGAEALVIVGYSESQIILRESIANNLFKTYYFVDGNRSEDLAAAVGVQNVEGLRGVAPSTGPATDSSLAWFAAYKERHGPFSSTFYGGVREAYDAVVAIALAAEAANSVEGPAIRNQLQSVASPGGLKIIASQASIEQGLRAVAQGTDVDYEGAASSVNWNEAGDLSSGYVNIWEFQNGIPITQKTIPFEYPDTGIIPIPVTTTVALALGVPNNGDVSADCTPNCDTLAVGTAVSVTAVPDRGYELTGWECTGSCPSDGTATTVSFAVSRDTRITPIFDDTGAAGDHGDTPSDATEIGIGSSIEGELALKSGAQDLDYFRVVVSETAILEFYTTGSVDTFGRLFASNGVSRIAGDDDGGTGYNFRITRELVPGTYYIEVRPFGRSEGDYTLYVSEHTEKMDDHGDDPATATEIGIGFSIEGELALKSGGFRDSDYFRVVVSETATLEFYTTGSIDTFGQLFTSNGVSRIADDDDGGADDNFRITSELVPGTYYIEVEVEPFSLFRIFEGDTLFRYTLYVSEYTEEMDDHGDNPAAATEIGIGSSIEGKLLKSGGFPDSDYFRVVVSETATLAFYTTGNTDTLGRLFASNGVSLIARDDWGGAGDNFRITSELVPGTYYVEVAPDRSDEGDYTLYVSEDTEEMDDHGDNPAAATEIGIGSSIEGKLLKSGGFPDSDYFRVVVSETATLAFYTTGRVDTLGRLFASDGVSQIASGAHNGTEDNFRITRLLVPGTYYIEVAPYRNRRPEGDYTLYVSEYEEEMDDHSDNPATATEIGIGSSIEGELVSFGRRSPDLDYFRVVVSETAILAFYTTGSVDTFGQLFASDGISRIADDDLNGADDNFRITRELVPGTYYIEVASYRVDEGDYTLYVLDVSEYEEEMDDYGDNPAAATEISIGSSIEGELLKNGGFPDSDYFRVVVSETATLAFYTTGSVNTLGRLFASDGVSRIAVNYQGGADDNFRIARKFAPGTYYLEVASLRGDEGDYTLYVSEYVFKIDDHGDNPAAATEIGIGSSIEGELAIKNERSQDLDYFRVVVSETAILRVYATGSVSMIGRLFASDGVSEIVDARGRILSITRELAPGTYYLEVGPFGSNEGDYTLYVSEELFKIDDHGDSPAEATEIGIGSSMEGELTKKSGETTDLDYFRVVVSEAATLAFYTTGSTNTVGRLFTSDGVSLIVDADDGGTYHNFRIIRELVPGTYYIEVAPFTSYFERARGDYTLYVSEYTEEMDDHGDNPAAATEISIGSSIEGELVLKIGGAPDLDYFRVVVSETATLAFYTRGSTNTVGRLFASDGVSLIDFGFDRGADDNFKITGELVPGTYYIEVGIQDEVTIGIPGFSIPTVRFEGDYTLYVSEYPDHGDNPATATEIGIGSSIEGDLALKSGGFPDLDYFRVVVSEAATLTFYTTGSTDTSGRLFASDGVSLIATDNQRGADDNFRIVRELAPGTYYLAITPHISDEGDYTLYVSEYKEEKDDHGDDPATATEIGIGSSIEGELTKKSGGFPDLDYFRVVVSETATLAFYTMGNTDMVGQLFASDGVSLIADNDDGGTDLNFRITSELVPGTYYVEVRPFDFRLSNGGSYTLVVADLPR